MAKLIFYLTQLFISILTISNFKFHFSHATQNLQFVADALDDLFIQRAVMVLQVQHPVVPAVLDHLLLEAHLPMPGLDVC